MSGNTFDAVLGTMLLAAKESPADSIFGAFLILLAAIVLIAVGFAIARDEQRGREPPTFRRLNAPIEPTYEDDAPRPLARFNPAQLDMPPGDTAHRPSINVHVDKVYITLVQSRSPHARPDELRGAFRHLEDLSELER